MGDGFSLVYSRAGGSDTELKIARGLVGNPGYAACILKNHPGHRPCTWPRGNDLLSFSGIVLYTCNIDKMDKTILETAARRFKAPRLLSETLTGNLEGRTGLNLWHPG